MASGFETPVMRLDRIPYLNSPASCQARSELVLTMASTKAHEVAAPTPFASLPLFLREHELALPRPAQLVQLNATHAFHAEVLSLIDGKRSLRDVCATLGQKYRIPPDDLAGSLTAFLASIYEMAARI